MKTVMLEAAEDREFGGIGLRPVGVRQGGYNPARDGLTIAHDLIEHVNGVRMIGSIDDELEALGAIWYVRGQWGELRRDDVGSRFTVEQNIASDVVRMFADFFNGAHVDLSPLRTKACEADDSFRDIIAEALKGTRGEVRDSYRGTLRRSTEIEKREAEYIAVCLPRMRIGYRKAKAKYHKLGRFAANNLFWEVVDAVENYAKHAEFEGAQYRLTYGFQDGQARARCEEFYGDEYA